MFAPRGANSPPARHRREASALWAVARSAKRPEGGERNERRARPAPSAKIERPGKAGRYEFTLEGTEGSVSPVGCCHRRWQSDPKESTETSGGRGQRPPRRLRLRNYGPPNLPERVYQQSDSEAAAGHVACRRFAFFDSNCPYSPETAFAAAATSATGAGASVMTPMACRMMTRMPSTATYTAKPLSDTRLMSLRKKRMAR